MFWRLRSWANARVPVLNKAGRLAYSAYCLANGSFLPRVIQFAGAPCFPHGPRSVFISSAARFGRDCVIFQQTTIGSDALRDSPRFGSPTIGDRCYIGAGAKIIGRIRVGSDVRIGAGAVVTRDIPDNATVVGFNVILLRAEPRDNRMYGRDGAAGWKVFQEGRWQAADGPEALT